ncbi:hypothetical protein Cflav_PD3114 [Pedosphaera parvula Ellin514]|uniref:Uncharacterized protein n=1 Tax=Pedosphaera parvula (strain Ellin514) TaxID=320771 RepID=B9XJJ4_PEDPL|nr:hypothetical protein Cflav_PD3114 [Pedosphaera parvula Ellin514]
MPHSHIISTITIPPGPSPLLLAFIISVFTAFSLAAVVGLFTLRDWSWRRFIPLSCSILAILPTICSHLGLNETLLELACFSYLPAIALLCLTLFLARRARGLSEHVLRSASLILFLYGIYNAIRAI